jgi:hypothetical protein
MALLQKEEIENRKKILELEHALNKNEEIMSRSNAARINSWLKRRRNDSAASRQHCFRNMDKRQARYHSDRIFENKE